MTAAAYIGNSASPLSAPDLLHEPVACDCVFVSDEHLGFSFSNQTDFWDFLHHIAPKNLCIGGDLINSVRSRLPFRQDLVQKAVLSKISDFAEHGVHVVVTRGNHDPVLDSYDSFRFPRSVGIFDEASYIAPDGQRLLILHGHQFDGISLGYLWLSAFGSLASEAIGGLSDFLDRRRADKRIADIFKALGLRKQWTLANTLQHIYGRAAYKDRFEKAAFSLLFASNAAIAAKNEMGVYPPEPYFTGIVCGHTHLPVFKETPSPRDDNGRLLGPPTVSYMNTGCWTGLFGKTPGAAGVFRSLFPNNTAFIRFQGGQTMPAQWIPGTGIIRPRLRPDGMFRSPASRKDARMLRF